MPFANVDSAETFFTTAGDGEPLLLFAGQATDHRDFETIISLLAQHYQTIAFDYPGTGQSGKGQTPYSTRDFANLAASLLDHLNIEKAHVFGASMGGRVAQWFAIDHADRLGTLILGCTTPGGKNAVLRAPEIDADMIALPADLEKGAEILAKYMVSPEYLSQHPEFIDRALRLNNPDAESRKLHYEASQQHDTWDLLPNISAPTLVIHGTEDRMNPTANANRLAAQIPNAELKLINHARHNFFIEFPTESISSIVDFLSRHPLDNKSAKGN